VRDVPLTIEEARQLAIRNNLDLKVELISPAIAREQLNAELAQYEWIFTTDAAAIAHPMRRSPTACRRSCRASQSQDFRDHARPFARRCTRRCDQCERAD
jgi:hypothetical protein